MSLSGWRKGEKKLSRVCIQGFCRLALAASLRRFHNELRLLTCISTYFVITPLFLVQVLHTAAGSPLVAEGPQYDNCTNTDGPDLRTTPSVAALVGHTQPVKLRIIGKFYFNLSSPGSGRKPTQLADFLRAGMRVMLLR